jgi:hypothetical protein
MTPARSVYAAGEAIASDAALEVDAVGFSSPHLINCTLPHRRPQEIPFVRRTPWCELTLNGLPQYGVPYGSPARLFLAYVQTEAVRTGSRELKLAPTLYEAARRIGVGTDTRAIRRFKRQLLACFTTVWTAEIKQETGCEILTFTLGSRVSFGYDPNKPKQIELWCPEVTLSEDFYNALMERRIPFDLRALKALARSPLAMDLYTWLVITAPKLQKPQFTPYTWLMQQWGVGYDPGSKQARNAFQGRVARELRNILRLWPELRLEATVSVMGGKQRGGLLIYPTKPHVAQLRLVGE